ncbi:MAG: hypothetical protein IT232_06240 [Flavobacteriales bacterium]|nr:hypothetical protein [Flavobacteriales bacterium]
MKKKGKLGLIYIVISTIILASGFLYQEYLYSIGGGYQMWDLQAILYFIIFSILYAIYWIKETKKK